ncbi:MAG: phosphatidate cytidylyltransferase [bacterium]
MKRIVTALVLGGAVVVTVLWAPAVVGTSLTAVFSVIAVGELAHLVRARGQELPVAFISVCAIIMIMAAWLGGMAWLFFSLAGSIAVLIFFRVVAGEVSGSLAVISFSVFALIYPPWLLAHVPLMLTSAGGRRALLFLLVVIWTCDSAAFFVGSSMGKRKLLESVSPNKTVEGAVAGMLSAPVVAVVFSASGFIDWSIGFAVIIGLVTAFLGQVGDLAESMVKRDAGVKDSGTLIPGHGGVLDRIDALLFAIPVFFYMILLFGGGFG